MCIRDRYFGFVKKQCTIPFLVLVALIAAIIIGGLTSWVVIRAGSYSKLLSIKDGDFASEVEEISYNQIPMLDEVFVQHGDLIVGDLDVYKRQA